MISEIYTRKIGQCEDLEQYEQLVQEHQAFYIGWSDHVLPMLSARDLNASAIAEGCSVKLKTAKTFCEKIPTKRKNVIMMAMMMRLSVEETNDLLMRWGKYQKLYAKHPEDAIWIYLLNKGGSDHPHALFQDYYAQYEKMRKIYNKSAEKKHYTPMESRVVHENIIKSAAVHSTYAENDEDFKELMLRIIPSFEEAYQKLMDYIDVFFTDIEVDQSRRLGLDTQHTKHLNGKITPNDMFKNNAYFRSAYYSKISALKKKHTMPSRLFLIALGIHLSMDTDELNTMLELAGMGPLCPKDRLEGAIVFFMEELYCEFPSCFYKPYQLQMDPVFEQLKDHSNAGGMQSTVPILMDGLDDVPVEQLDDYIKRRLEESGIFDDNQTAYMKFLQML